MSAPLVEASPFGPALRDVFALANTLERAVEGLARPLRQILNEPPAPVEADRGERRRSVPPSPGQDYVLHTRVTLVYQDVDQVAPFELGNHETGGRLRDVEHVGNLLDRRLPAVLQTVKKHDLIARKAMGVDGGEQIGVTCGMNVTNDRIEITVSAPLGIFRHRSVLLRAYLALSLGDLTVTPVSAPVDS